MNYRTKNFSLSAALKLSGFDLIDIREEGGVVYAFFEDSLELKEAISAYWNNEIRLNTKDFSDTTSEIRKEILRIKHS